MSTPYAWLNTYPEGIDWYADLPSGPLYGILDRSESLYPERIAIEFKGRTWTYKELGESVRRMARGLHTLGIGKGSKVGLFMPNCPQFIISYFAVLRAGATVVNYNPLYSPRELKHQIEDSGTEIMITLALNLLYPKLEPYIGTTPLKRVIISQMTEALPATKAALFATARRKEIAAVPSDSQHIPFSELMKHPPEVESANIDPERDLAVLQYTGGTTGVPKGVELTHDNLSVNVEQCMSWLQSDGSRQDSMMGVLPFFHVFAMTVCMNFGIAGGMKIILHPRFELKTLLEDIHHKRPTLMPGVATMYGAIINYRRLAQYDLTSINTCIAGGGPLPAEIKTRFEELTGCRLLEGYGLSEASPVVGCNPLSGENRTGSFGLPLPQTIIEVVDKEDRQTVLPQGEVGELCIRGPQVMRGYYNKPEATAEVIRNGRLHTGDVGYMDEDGYFYIVDRLKEMIISGGYNIYPRELEEVIYMHEAVAECAVIGIDHPMRGQAPKAYIVCKEKHTLTGQEMRDFLKDKLSAYAIPHDYEFRDELPKSMIGKILKKELLAEEKARIEQKSA
jgi:long-chain acyl-CoA synthetase